MAMYPASAAAPVSPREPTGGMGGRWPTAPVGPETLRIRMATTMTGGVSLAVWMGGVARELNLLLQASDQRRAGTAVPPAAGGDAAVRGLYRGLLGLLDALVDVDVLSGTSAGGINAVLLAYSRVQGRDLGGLRGLWLDVGSLLDLLRSPTDKDVPSLLYGDEYMLDQLDRQLPLLARYPVSGQARPPHTTLYVTTTLLTGESSRFTDAIGTQVQDTTQRGLFTFDEELLAGEVAPRALALAARSTASFPGAFEPSFVPFDEDVPAAGRTPVRPAMADFADITRSHWVADGGLLDNQPLDVLWQRIFDEPAREPVRRLLLYVVPTAGPTPDLVEKTPGDKVDHPYGLLETLLKDLGAATSQSINRDLRAVRDHNDNVDARYDLRRQLADLGMRLPAGQRLLSMPALHASQRRQHDLQARPLVRAMLRVVSTWPKEKVPRPWQEPLGLGGDGEAECQAAMERTLAPHQADTPAAPVAAAPSTAEQFAQYGRVTLDAAKAIVLWVLRTAYGLAGNSADREALVDAVAALHGVGRRPRVHPAPFARRTCGSWGTPPAPMPATLTDAASSLATAWRDATAVAPESWHGLQKVLTDGDMLARLTRLVAAPPTIPADGPRPDAGTDASEDAGADGSESDDGGASTGDPGPVTDAARLRPLVRYLSGAGGTSVGVRLFDLAATELSILPPGAFPAQTVELVQVSADTRSALAPDHKTAEQKLTGLQAHHFGAFYKRSWRANDWMWGRLDGSGWLVHVLLDPRRLAYTVDRAPLESPAGPPNAEPAETPGPKARWLVAQLTEIAELPAPDAKHQLWQEISFLDDPPEHRSLPRSVPELSLWLAQAWQRQIAAQELPNLADTILGPESGNGAAPDWSPTATRDWARAVRSAGRDVDALAHQLNACAVPKETFGTDRGSPLFARTVTKAAATTTAAAASVRQLPSVARPAVNTARTVAIGGHRLVDSVKGSTRGFLLAGLALLAVGIALTLQSGTILGFSGLALAMIGGYAVTIAVWQRSTRLLGALVAVTFTGAVLSLAIPAERRWLFGTSSTDCAPKKTGCVLGRHFYWLGDQWWHPLLAIGILLAVVVAIPYLIRAIGAATARRLSTHRAVRDRSNSRAM